MCTMKVKKMLLLVSILSYLALFHCNAEADIHVEIILDGSGSMWETIGEEYKIVIVRDALKSYLNSIPDNVQVGLRVFGSLKKARVDDCQNTRLIHPVTMFNKKALIKKISRINPAGKAPLAFAVKEAYNDFKDSEEKKAIIVIADGPDTCQRLSCKWLENELTGSKSIPVHILGFHISTESAHNKLYCITSKLKGKYFKVSSKRTIVSSLKRIIASTLEQEKARLQEIENQKIAREQIRQKTRLEITVSNALEPLYADSLEIINPRIDEKSVDLIVTHVHQGQTELLYKHLMNEGPHLLTLSFIKIKGESRVQSRFEEIDFTIEKGKTTLIHLTAHAGVLYYGFSKTITFE